MFVCRISKIVIILIVFWIEMSVSNNYGPLPIDATNTTTTAYDDDVPTETQTAQCTITSGDVKASAQASVTSRLDGVCESSDMMKAFALLETRLLQELFNIRIVLSHIQHPNYNPMQHYQFLYSAFNLIGSNYQQLIQHPTQIGSTPLVKKQQNYPKTPSVTNDIPSDTKPFISSTTKQTTESFFATTEGKIHFMPIEEPKNQPSSSTVGGLEKVSQMTTPQITATTDRIPEVRPMQLKSLPLRKNGPRDFEIYKFNNTILSGDEIQIFTYYWKIENYTQKLKSNATELSSPIFIISGLYLRVKANLNYLNRDYLYLQMDTMSKEMAEKGKASNIILETGSLFKEIETKKLFRHKIIILDQATQKSDLVSQEFMNTNVGFLIPNSAILSSSYLKENSVLIKIIIYL